MASNSKEQSVLEQALDLKTKVFDTLEEVVVKVALEIGINVGHIWEGESGDLHVGSIESTPVTFTTSLHNPPSQKPRLGLYVSVIDEMGHPLKDSDFYFSQHQSDLKFEEMELEDWIWDILHKKWACFAASNPAKTVIFLDEGEVESLKYLESEIKRAGASFNFDTDGLSVLRSIITK